MTCKQYHGIARACTEIAFDNGGINRGRSEQQQDREFRRWLAKQPEEILGSIDAWLAGLSDEVLEVVCCGEASEADAALADAPPFTSKLLNDYFEEVC